MKPLGRSLNRVSYGFALLTLALLSSVACTKSGSQTSTITLNLPNFGEIAANEQAKLKAKSAKDSTQTTATTLGRIMVNVTGPGISTPIVYLWQAASSTDTPPTAISLTVPSGSSRLVQALLLVEGSITTLTSPYNCSNSNGGANTQTFYYGDQVTDLASGSQAVNITVNALGISQGLQGKVSGRFLPTAGVNAGPTGVLTLLAAIPGRPAMIVDNTSQVIDGWFSGFALEGLTFNYQVGGVDILGQGLDIANAGSFLSAAAIPPSQAFLVQTASGWAPQSAGEDSSCGGVQVNAQKILYGAFGPGASAMNLCAPASTTLDLFSSYTYASTFIFTGAASWNATSTQTADARVIYPVGGVGVGIVGQGACASGTDLSTRLTFAASSTDNSGNGEILPVDGPFSTLSGGLSITPNSSGYALSWTYLPNMAGLLAGSDVFVRTGVYASGSSSSPQGQADFQDQNNGYLCSALTSLGFQLAGTAGKTAGALQSSFKVAGISSANMMADQVQIVVCPKLLSGSYLNTALACGAYSQCGFVSVPTLSTQNSLVTSTETTVSSGGSVVLTLSLRDSNNNPLATSGQTVAFSISGGTSSGTFSMVTDNGNGTYSSTFVATTAGTPSTFSATLNGMPVMSTMPSITVLAGAANAAASLVTSASSAITVGQTTLVTLQARDAVANPISTGGASVSFTAVGGTSVVSLSGVTDLGNGTYTVLAKGVAVGTATTIQASISGSTSTSTATITVINPITRVAFIANQGESTLSIFGVDLASGTLTPAPLAKVPTGSSPQSVAVDPGGRFVYVANSGAGTLSQYSIDPGTAALTPLTPASVPAGTSPQVVTIDPSGRFVYVTNYGSNNISCYKVDPAAGTLTLIQTIASGTGPQAITVDPSGQFVYVGNYVANTVSEYDINANSGSLTLVTTVAAGTSPLTVAFEPTGRFLYVANYGSNNVSMYSINTTTGAPTPLSPSTIPTGTNPSSVLVDSTGRFAYVANQNSSTISMYLINPSGGQLTALGNGTVATSSGTKSLGLDPSGRYVYAVSASGVTTYSIDPVGGALTSTGSSIGAGSGSSAVATTAGPSRYAYSTNVGSNNITMYSINPTTGSLTPLSTPSIATGTYPYSVVVDPSGRFAYATGSVSNNVYEYSINRTTGVLVPLNTPTIAAGSGALGIAIDPTGRFVYVANGGVSTISMYSINATTGSLTSIGTATGGVNPQGLSFDRAGRYLYAANYAGTVTMFAIDSTTGSLGTAVSYTGGGATISVATSPNGRFLYAAARDGSLRTFAIDPGSGSLGTPTVLSTVTDDYFVTLDRSGRFAFTANESPSEVVSYTVNLSSGVLTASGTPVSAGTYVQNITTDQTARFAYASNYNDGTISEFAINPATGILTPLSTPVIPSGLYCTSTITVR